MNNELLKKLHSILSINLENEQFGVKELTEAVGMSRAQLHRKLHELSDKSTSQFIREYRLEKAMEMLQKNVATASEIAYRVGFKSPTYFNTSFREYYGYPPGEVKFRNPSTNELLETHQSKHLAVLEKEEKIISRIDKISSRQRLILLFSLVFLLIIASSYLLYFSTPNSIETATTEEIINKKSIAVLPFKNLSIDTENEYFVDGMMDAILNHLSGIQGLVVKSRQSSERYIESNKSMINIGKELGANYLLDGSVQKQKNNIRIIVQLIDAKQDTQIWAENYDFELDQVFVVQSEISEQIAQKLNTVISSIGFEQINNTPTKNVEAYNLYLKGRFFWNRRSEEEDLNKSIHYFEKALELDSTYSLAYSGLADSYFSMAWFGKLNRNEAFSKGKTLALKAISIDNKNPAPHATLGGIATYHEWNWKSAEKEFKQAITLNPNYATAYLWYAELLDILGRNKEARKHLDLAIKLNPNSYIIYSTSAMLHAKMGQYDKALIDARRAKEINKNQGWSDWIIFEIYTILGKDDEAIAQMEESWNSQSVFEMAKGSRFAYDKYGIKGVYKYIINYDLENNFTQNQAYRMAQKYAFIEENKKALEWLEIAIEHRELEIPKIKNDPYFRNLHNEPRFKAILKKMKLEDL